VKVALRSWMLNLDANRKGCEPGYTPCFEGRVQCNYVQCNYGGSI